ncbi:MAG: secondary thiamine-phosphate synthase enzyme YjbQ [Chryseolinea sp.]
MKFFQRELVLQPFPRGFHLITRKIESEFTELRQIQMGQLQVFIKHTSASLSLNENADPTVRGDFERHFNVMVPENARYYQHDTEGSDDMPAHIKAAVLGSSVTIPITNGKLNLGTWQGIYLCEHRNHGGERELVLTAFGSLVEAKNNQ